MCGIFKEGKNERRERSSMTSITYEFDENETNVDRVYDNIEDYMNTSSTTQCGSSELGLYLC